MTTSHLVTGADPIPEILCTSSVFQTTDVVQRNHVIIRKLLAVL
jgi:hypothetical protein